LAAPPAKHYINAMIAKSRLIILNVISLISETKTRKLYNDNEGLRFVAED
jgi:hypothetical protein